ncbi:cell wall protein DAN4 isoform X1 [Drosophila novamexicana]|uniref:cell wall protein DAN4 isoform X1 n=1 Tax=Drosophila novamexicana TaxID=47314 RepID=UPI0011E5D32E|nr:cell wall protein DAN4 isoform X1 [Drosophila novamexicana]XP_030564604.1 cell wall protein DAN4 isoform X1 [Drosophila novamexicana]XP_030564606.1 cell wall protein DAN4 isoform X1 [Drosophila novamexicana]XP_030564607.1 cell wall protein DAN4 isoform X1 [Drosophila novamexicana]
MHYTLNNKMWQPSTQHILTLILCSTLCLISASPLPHPAGNQELDVLQIPLTNGKEIDVLTLGAKDQDQLIADRNKRTIGLLRELFPDITKEIDSIVNRIIAQVIRVAGPGLLNSVLAGNRGSGGARGSTTPSTSFDADFDDDGFADDDDDDDVSPASAAPTPASDGALNSDDNGSRVKIDLPTLAPDAETSANKVSARKSQANVTASTLSSISTSTTTSPSPSPSPTTIATKTLTIGTDVPFELLSRFLGTEPTSATAATTATVATEMLATTREVTSVTTTTDNSQLAPTSTFTTSTQYPQNKDNNNIIEEPQLLTIIADINRLLNSTNYFITTRDNLTTTTTTTTTTSSTTSLAPPTTTTVATTIDNHNITKLLPVYD